MPDVPSTSEFLPPPTPAAPSVGAPPPPHPYNPGFSRAVTLASALVLCGSIALIAWLSFDVPRVDRVSEPARALSHMVGRLMDLEEGLQRLPTWEHRLYDLTMGSDVNDRAQAIDWYRELAQASPDPFVELHTAILEGEADGPAALQAQVTQWERQGELQRWFARLIRAAYLDAPLAPTEAVALQARLAEAPIQGWFYDRVAMRLAERTGDRPLLATIQASTDARTAILVRRARALAWLESAVMLMGPIVWWWARRRHDPGFLRVGSAELPPLWAGSLGAGVLLRGGAVGAVLTVLFVFAAIDSPSLRVIAVPLSNVPLLAMAYVHLLRPQRQTFVEGFGLRLAPRGFRALALVVPVVTAAGLLGEWVIGRVAEPLQLVSHWTEWFDADLVWGAPTTLAVSLMEYVLFAPLFEELVFRGLLFGVFRRRLSWAPAALLSASLFAVAHGYGLIGFVSVLWSGLLWAWAYERTGSLWPGILGHALNNLLVCVSVMALLRG